MRHKTILREVKDPKRIHPKMMQQKLMEYDIDVSISMLVALKLAVIYKNTGELHSRL
jgi:hypothetical protein